MDGSGTAWNSGVAEDPVKRDRAELRGRTGVSKMVREKRGKLGAMPGSDDKSDGWSGRNNGAEIMEAIIININPAAEARNGRRMANGWSCENSPANRNENCWRRLNMAAGGSL